MAQFQRLIGDGIEDLLPASSIILRRSHIFHEISAGMGSVPLPMRRSLLASIKS